MQRITIQLFFFGMLLCMPRITGYGLPGINLGLSNFLDGGPLRPRPGLYYQHFFVNYNTHKFLNADGKPLLGLPSPHYNEVSTIAAITYQADARVFKALPGISVSLPIVLSSTISHNTLCLTNSGSGVGDLVIGGFLQWSPGEYREKARFVQRLEFDVKFPTGKNKSPRKSINPGDNVFCLNPYWAFTFYFTPRWATSWRLYYLWCGTNHSTHFKAGDAFHTNATMEFQAKPDLWVGINTYFLYQLKDNRINGVKIPNSREQVFGVGPGFLYAVHENYDLIFFGNLYFETLVKNRPQGITAVLRLFKYFN